MPPLLLFLLMVGSIYAGIATPTEAAALGVMGAMILATAVGAMSWQLMLTPGVRADHADDLHGELICGPPRVAAELRAGGIGRTDHARSPISWQNWMSRR